MLYSPNLVEEAFSEVRIAPSRYLWTPQARTGALLWIHKKLLTRYAALSLWAPGLTRDGAERDSSGIHRRLLAFVPKRV